MEVEDLGLNGALLIKPTIFGDDRGYFLETYRRDAYREAGVILDEVQMNRSRSSHGVLRAIHFQLSPGQPKLVSCAHGEVFNVAVDLRLHSPTFGMYAGVALTERNGYQLYLPVGFGNGFVVVSETASYNYIVGSLYDPATEAEIAYNDPQIDIDWPIENPIVSERDKQAPLLKDFDWSKCTWQR